jgi:cytochrome d ubiquinol oxidase subunit I
MVVTYWTFRFMMTIGFLMMGLSFLFLLATRKDYEHARWMKWVPWVIALPYIANSSGWILTEMGRQPWIVQGLLTVEKAVSPNLTTLDLLISLIGYAVVYGSLAVAMVKLMKKYAVAGPDAAMHESVDVEPESGPLGDILPIGAQD